LLQDDATGDRVAAEALGLLEHPDRLAAQRLAFQKVEGSLGEPGAGERAAQSVLRLVGYPEEPVGRDSEEDALRS
jgi:hypothetical protein